MGDLERVCPGGRCDGSGLIVGAPQCTLDCTALKHSPTCGRSRPTLQCPACAAAELGEDLYS
jgi:hypothetical protein